MSRKVKRKKNKFVTFLVVLMLLAALGVLGYSGWKIYDMKHDMHIAEDVYEDLREDFINDCSGDIIKEVEKVRPEAEDLRADDSIRSFLVSFSDGASNDSIEDIDSIYDGDQKDDPYSSVEENETDREKETGAEENESEQSESEAEDGKNSEAKEALKKKRAKELRKKGKILRKRLLHRIETYDWLERYLDFLNHQEEKAPIEIDWEELLKLNEDIVGWVYIEGIPTISYPIVQGDDDDYYVFRTFTREDSKHGCIFLTSYVNEDFSSPHSIVYGHNMRDGTMFSLLSDLRSQETLDEYPYFWILTPEHNYKYQIFTVFQTNRISDVFQVFSKFSNTYNSWLRTMQSRSLFEFDVELGKWEHVVSLVSCVPQTTDRTIVMGRCISKVKPPSP